MKHDFDIQQLERRLWRRSYRGMLGIGLALVIAWAVLLKFISQGWGIIAIHIGFLVGTIFTIGIGSLVFFRRFMRDRFAVPLAAVIWVAFVAGIRSIVLTVLGVI